MLLTVVTFRVSCLIILFQSMSPGVGGLSGAGGGGGVGVSGYLATVV